MATRKSTGNSKKSLKTTKATPRSSQSGVSKAVNPTQARPPLDKPAEIKNKNATGSPGQSNLTDQHKAAPLKTKDAPDLKTDIPEATIAASQENPVPLLARLPRIPVTEIKPSFEDGLWPAKAVEGESFPIQATVFREGHDAYGAEAVLLDPEGQEVQRSRMYDVAPGLDRLEAWVKPTAPGDWSFRVDTWSDPYETWAHSASLKIAAGIDVELELEQGARLFERAASGKAIDNPTQQLPTSADKEALLQAAAALRNQTQTAQSRLSAGLHSSIRHIFRTSPLRDLFGSSRTYPLRVDREGALYASWYEIFIRSIGAYCDEFGKWHSGTLQTAAKDLPRIAQMGFDVVYLTPISPIGLTFRKGKNNALQAGADDPGSPYGIGSQAGGHDAIHPDLGDFSDFDAFVRQARCLGMEVALDIALQCSPDHPWVKQHPDWFTQRPDGSIAYAENPPKKYQDIYPLNFDRDPEGIYRAIRDLLEVWVEHGVTIFRVDNPHTKPVAFWQRLLAEFRQTHPEVLFLAEAFTRPAMMRTLAQVGFHQSYTYFAWRNDKAELESYFHEVAWDSSAYMRPSFWPTTHDILTQPMVEGGEAAFGLRAVLAATGSPLWGIYNGYELVENVQRPGFEEQIDNEKYQYKPRDYSSPLAQRMSLLLGNLNRIRRQHPALQRLRNLQIHRTSHPSLICYSRQLDAWESPTGKADQVIVVVNLDPHQCVSGEVYLDLGALKLAGGYDSTRPCMRVQDELDGAIYQWGAVNYVELNPQVRPAHVFGVSSL